MRRYSLPLFGLLWLVNFTLAQAPAPTEADKEIAVVELGGALGRSLTAHSNNYGLDFAAEVTPIEGWLELEAGTSPVFTRTTHEWDTDVLFKKPWTFSRSFEFMLGAGPEWQRSTAAGRVHNAWAGEAILDFMFWPRGDHRFGWYLEPSYDYSFATGHEKSLGLTGGWLITIR